MDGPFTPADGATPRWRKCYDLVSELQPGDGIAYAEVMELCDCDLAGAQAAMREAKARLESDKRPTVATRKRYGWVVLDRGTGNLSETEQRSRKAGRAVGRAARVLAATDRAKLDQLERARMDHLSGNLLTAHRLYQRRPASLLELERLSQGRRNEPPGQRQIPGSRPATQARRG